MPPPERTRPVLEDVPQEFHRVRLDHGNFFLVSVSLHRWRFWIPAGCAWWSVGRVSDDLADLSPLRPAANSHLTYIAIQCI